MIERAHGSFGRSWKNNRDAIDLYSSHDDNGNGQRYTRIRFNESFPSVRERQTNAAVDVEKFSLVSQIMKWRKLYRRGRARFIQLQLRPRTGGVVPHWRQRHTAPAGDHHSLRMWTRQKGLAHGRTEVNYKNPLPYFPVIARARAQDGKDWQIVRTIGFPFYILCTYAEIYFVTFAVPYNINIQFRHQITKHVNTRRTSNHTIITTMYFEHNIHTQKHQLTRHILFKQVFGCASSMNIGSQLFDRITCNISPNNPPNEHGLFEINQKKNNTTQTLNHNEHIYIKRNIGRRCDAMCLITLDNFRVSNLIWNHAPQVDEPPPRAATQKQRAGRLGSRVVRCAADKKKCMTLLHGCMLGSLKCRIACVCVPQCIGFIANFLGINT